jgi:hypothetical protein
VLADLPADRRVGVGVVNQKHDRVETLDEIAAAARRAIAIFGSERVLLTPDCGFATFADNPVTRAQVAEQKLRAIVAAAAQTAKRLRSAETEAPREGVDAARERAGVGNGAVGGHPIDDLGKQLGEAARCLVPTDSRLARDLLEAVAPEDLRHRIRRDRLVRAAGHPRVGLLAEASVL